MANPWDNDPVVEQQAGGNPWDADPVVGESPRAKSVSELPKKSSTVKDFAKGAAQQVGNFYGGVVRGAGSIGATLLWPYDKATDLIMDDRGPTVEGLISGQQPKSRNQERREAMDWSLGDIGADKDSALYQTGKIGGEIAGTAGVGPALAAGANATRLGVAAPSLVKAVGTSGMSAGNLTGAKALGVRALGGGITGGLAAGAIDPNNAPVGAAIGAALPPALKGIGALGSTIGRKMAGPAVAPEMTQAIQNARNSGYVIPPTQAKPSLVNRALEGFAGKLTTAQNASARNQPVTNELARKAIGANDLSEASIAQVRNQANQAYDALGQVGKFTADADFVQALDRAGSTTATMRANFPELVNSKVDDLIEGLKSRPEFDSRSTIEAIKQFRADAATNKASLDPAAKALGRAQSKISDSLEDLIERNLQASGNPQLLEAYRGARQTLAKTYQVEKALNKTSGNVDANKLAQMMQKGKPMTGDLRSIADFAARFPKANQTVERMGSLPGLSPLDFGALGTVSAVSGNPLLMAGVLARPAARAATLSAPVQNRLAQIPSQSALQRLLANQKAEQALLRAVPALVAPR